MIARVHRFGLACVVVGALTASLFCVPAVAETEPATAAPSPYETTVVREVEGSLDSRDLHQVSVLGSRVLQHVFEAGDALADKRADEAARQVELAQTLVGVMRELLPTTRVTTTVTNSEGREVYRYQDELQGDRIPLHEDMIAVQVLEMADDARAKDAGSRGVRLTDVDLIRKRSLLELSYVERKLDAAARALAEQPPATNEAVASLLLAGARGVRVVVQEDDDPLIEATHALTLAERLVDQGHEEAARENLMLARRQLELHRSLLTGQDSERSRELEREIRGLEQEIDGPGVAARIRQAWHGVTGLFQKQPGEAVTDAPDEPTPSS